MRIAEVIQHLEQIAPSNLQESYDNSGLLVGEKMTDVSGVVVSLDCIEATVHEAISKKCNLIVAHHPIVFGGLKRFNNANYVQRTVQLAIKNDIAIYAIHTNLDNVYHQGVNSKIAERLGLTNTQILAPKLDTITKLVTYCPILNEQDVRNALFAAGAGHIGNYSECSFTTQGSGTYTAGSGTKPTKGEVGSRHTESEVKIEVVVPSYLTNQVLNALKTIHPYEEVAYEIYPTLNVNQEVGSGMIGELEEAMNGQEFLGYLKDRMGLRVIKYTDFKKTIKKVAVCGGSGQFLLKDAKGSGADAYVTSDFKYHEYFDAEQEVMICDIGHYESEKFTIDLLYDILSEKFSTFAVLKTGVDTNPVKYFL
ncbi:MAG: Nif3-like dinuclear metal center hexameric protein [Bacteroidetes bacterium]|nr:MAG: Nif3-like dinuclear metal center hexameric protein [Bacteroidota bacterium]